MGVLSEEPPPASFAAQLIHVFTPDILQKRKPSGARIGSTAWLDGLRGVAALMVTLSHIAVYSYSGLEYCYRGKLIWGEEYNDTPASLPFIRLFFSSGAFAVSLFFVISGYVVPRRLLQAIHDGRKQDFLDDLHSAVVRRPIRLYIPVILMTLAVGLHWHLLGIPSPAWPKKDNVFLEVWHWVQETSLFCYVFRLGWLFHSYNVHTWTIPIELRGSMFLFVFLFSTHAMKDRTRILLTLVVMLHLSLGSSGAWFACFFGGMLLCDLELLSASGKRITLPWDGVAKWYRSNAALRQLILHVTFVAALYLASEPTPDDLTRGEALGSCPGWGTLSWLIPGAYWDADSQFRWYWLFWASLLIVYTVREIDWLRACFETRTTQYLGRHSFALYLIHGPTITTFTLQLLHLTGVKQMTEPEEIARFSSMQNKLRDASWWPLPDGGPNALQPNFLFCAAVSIPVILYIAEIGTKLLDIPGLKASKWVWKKWQTL